LKCLSVSQPFADLIISEKKTIELRNWNTNFRGEFLIHSPLKIRTDDSKRLKIKKKFVTGAIIGKAQLYDVKQYYSIKEIKSDFEMMYMANMQTIKKKPTGENLQELKEKYLESKNSLEINIQKYNDLILAKKTNGEFLVSNLM